MTLDEAREIFLNRGYIQVKGGRIYDGDKWRESVVVISKWLEQQPTAKENLVVGDCISREFIEIVVEYPPAELCTYPEYKGKPYFSIKYRENGKEYVGFGTYKIEFLSQWIKEYFMSDNQPKPKTGHWVEEKINGGRKVFCSECGCPPPFEYVSNGDVYSASGYGVINKTKFCPNCGARMVESQESEDKK